MAKCLSCNKRGLFLKVNSSGMCVDCEKKLAQIMLEEEKRKKEEQIRKEREEYIQNKKLEMKNYIRNLPKYEINISSEIRKRRTGFEEIPFSNITPKGKYNEFVVLDVETTGLAPSKDRIIELAAIRFVDGKPIEWFETFINPEREIPSEATAVNKITNEMVVNAPTISQILPALEDFVGKSDLVAHNMEFDLKFLYYSGSAIMETKRRYFDTLEQAQKLLKKPKMKYDKEFGMYDIDYDSDYDVYDYKLGTLCSHYLITVPEEHRAYADAFVTGVLFGCLIEEKQNR